MLKKARVFLPVAMIFGLIAVLPGASSADENALGKCPDGYQPSPFVAAPEEDRNNNGVVCVKPYPNGVLVHDDPNGKPYRCNSLTTPVGCIATSNLSDANALIQDDIID